jgi:adenosylcobinamide-GDP ribazoletransferase
MGHWLQRNIIEPGKLPLLLALSAFVLTFLITRVVTRLIRAGKGPFGNVEAGGVHIHHVVPGIILTLVGGFGAVASSRHGVGAAICAVIFGMGAGLVLDEFALIAAGILIAARKATAVPAGRSEFFVKQYAFVPLLPAALTLLVLALLTRGLHLDGLADTADGLASRKPAPQALEIMRTGPVGALGAATLVLVLLVQVTALTTCVLAHRGTQSVLDAVIVGRVAIVWACARGIPAARPDGMGALVAGTVSHRAAVAWTLALFAFAAGYGFADPDAGSAAGAVQAAVAVAVALAVAAIVLWHCVRRFGGVTGDVMGATAEIATTACLVVMAAGFAVQ